MSVVEMVEGRLDELDQIIREERKDVEDMEERLDANLAYIAETEAERARLKTEWEALI